MTRLPTAGLRPSACRVAQVLAAAGKRGATTSELGDAAGFRFGARVYDLREAGFVIRQQRIRDNQSRYWLERVPGQ